MTDKIKKIALLGNPNAGKSSLFNQLTGLRQKVGNFPGVTVERKSGIAKLLNQQEVEIIDLPGYTQEEKLQIALRYLVQRQSEANGLRDAQCPASVQPCSHPLQIVITRVWPHKRFWSVGLHAVL